ncbi:acid-sensing ion channel [Labeo rohita]|uniref:Acid-sensing ion channel n=1 Tax=Labeo rohita TaxID=84645 RepID=A0A498LDA1_LABRO|nr:acid-sensing ion channel [Labeo rohita]
MAAVSYRWWDEAPKQSDSTEAGRSRTSYLRDLAEQTSLHGIQNLLQPNMGSVRYSLWLLAILGSLGFLLHYFFSSIPFYFQYHHVTQLDEERSEIPFPAVTLCNVNPVRLSALTDCDVQHIGGIWGLSADIVLTKRTSRMGDVYVPRLNITKPECNLCRFDWQELYDRAAHRLWDMVKSCRFQGLHCTLEDFESVSNPWLLPLNFNPFSSL